MTGTRSSRAGSGRRSSPFLADLAVLSEDILGVPPERIRDIKVEMTVLGGKVVYERASEKDCGIRKAVKGDE